MKELKKSVEDLKKSLDNFKTGSDILQDKMSEMEM